MLTGFCWDLAGNDELCKISIKRVTYIPSSLDINFSRSASSLSVKSSSFCLLLNIFSKLSSTSLSGKADPCVSVSLYKCEDITSYILYIIVLSNHLHGHCSLFYFIHRHHNNAWSINAYLLIIKLYLVILVDTQLKLVNSNKFWTEHYSATFHMKRRFHISYLFEGSGRH